MGDEERRDIGELNRIVEDLLKDAKDLAEDLLSGIQTTLLMGAVSIVLGIQTLWYNRLFISAGDFVPLILALIMFVSGLIIVLRGYTLKKKYSRLYELQRKMGGI